MKFDCNHAWIFTRNRPCHCSECGVTRSRWERRNEPTIAELKQELAEWRSGKRRVVWKLTWMSASVGMYSHWGTLKKARTARNCVKNNGGECVYVKRIRTWPKGAKR